MVDQRIMDSPRRDLIPTRNHSGILPRRERTRIKRKFRKPAFTETKNPQQSAFELCLQNCKVMMKMMNAFMTGKKQHDCYQSYFKAQIISKYYRL